MYRNLTKKELKIKEIYQDTDCFVWENMNPKGKITGDCAFRALAKVCDIDWIAAMKLLSDESIRTGYAISSYENIASALKTLGFKKMKTLQNAERKRLTGKDFCEEMKRMKHKKVFCNIGSRHVTCVYDYKIHDIWDCSNGKVGIWWVKD